MVSLTALWLPILLAAVLVFLASSLIHMVLPYHRSDYGKVASEDKVMDALRPFGIPPGDYMVPCSTSPAAARTPEFIAKVKRGPSLIMTVFPSGAMAMGSSLAGWFVFCVVVGVFAGYLTSRALPAGAPYLEVFRFAGTIAFVGYALALWENTIWYKRAWTTTVKANIDGLIYALLTGGAFGWLWPQA
jgi:hypothetical protein